MPLKPNPWNRLSRAWNAQEFQWNLLETLRTHLKLSIIPPRFLQHCWYPLERPRNLPKSPGMFLKAHVTPGKTWNTMKTPESTCSAPTTHWNDPGMSFNNPVVPGKLLNFVGHHWNQPKHLWIHWNFLEGLWKCFKILLILSVIPYIYKLFEHNLYPPLKSFEAPWKVPESTWPCP